jgi:hypothetical protein
MERLPKPRLSLFSASVLLAVTPLLMSAPARVATQSPSWNVMSSPNITGAATELASVSCVSWSFCVAVGDAQHPRNGPDVPVVESWNGVSWSLVAIPQSRMESLSGISCLSSTFCMAVGTGLSKGFALSFDGRHWSVAVVPRMWFPQSVACASATFCVAVGNSEIESWDGKRWRSDAMPRLAPRRVADLNTVDCVSSRFCVAVGDISFHPNPYAGRAELTTLSETWNGDRWSIVPTPNVEPEGFYDILASVSCPSERSCVAVGDFGAPLTFAISLIISWNGTRWSRLSGAYVWAPGTAHQMWSLSDELEATSCIRPHVCTAVGTVLVPFLSSSTPGQSLVESWAGARWRAVRSPNHNSSDILKAVSCVAPSNCIAVGSYGADDYRYSTLIEASPAW